MIFLCNEYPFDPIHHRLCLNPVPLAIDSRLLWASACIFYGLSAVYGLLCPLQLLSVCLAIDVLLGTFFWVKRPKDTRENSF